MLYSTITFDPLFVLHLILFFAVVLLLYSLTVVPAEFCTDILLIYLSNFKSKFFNSIKPILISEISSLPTVIVSVEATLSLESPIKSSFNLAHLNFQFHFTPFCFYMLLMNILNCHNQILQIYFPFCYVF